MGQVMFQILSDLHLETHPSYEYSFTQTAPYLALLGDIGHVGDDRLFEFLEKQLKKYWVVFFLLGNHEPTHSTWAAAKQKVLKFSAKNEALRQKSTVGRFVFLDQTRYDLNDNITVLGCTLFSSVLADQIAAVSSRLVDFRHISDWSVVDHNEAHKSDVAWLNAQVHDIRAHDTKRQIAIFTHYCPSVAAQVTDPAHVGSEVSSGFMTDLGNEACWTSPSVVMWAFGHTHFSCDFEDDIGKKVVSNQKGYHYRGPEQDFSASKVFAIGRDSTP